MECVCRLNNYGNKTVTTEVLGEKVAQLYSRQTASLFVDLSCSPRMHRARNN